MGFFDNQQIWTRKPLSMFEKKADEVALKKVLGKWDLTFMGIGAIIGAGIFVLTGLAAKEFAGPALSLSFVIAAIGCTFAALCYAEFASMLPVEGSVYAYSYATMGELFAWMIGWDLILEYAMASSTVAVGWSGYFIKLLSMFGAKFPLWLVSDGFTAVSNIAEHTAKGTLAEYSSHFSSIDIPYLFGIPIGINFPAVFIIAAITMVVIRGIKKASTTNWIMVIIKLLVIIFVIIAGAFYINTQNWQPFVPEREFFDGNWHYGWMGVLSGAAYVFFAYIGFDAVSTQAGEAKNPSKDIPFGIITSLVVCTILYILVALVLTGMVHYKDIDESSPLFSAFAQYNMAWVGFIIAVAAVAGLSSVMLVMLIGQSRIFYAMSKDGLLPKKTFGALHPKFLTPYKSSILIGICVAVVGGLTPIDKIAKLVNMGTLWAFVLVCIAVLIMRKREPNRPRPFKTPNIYFVAPAGIVSNLAIMASLEMLTWVVFALWLAVGFVIYYVYSSKNSILGKYLKEKKLPEEVK